MQENVLLVIHFPLTVLSDAASQPNWLRKSWQQLRFWWREKNAFCKLLSKTYFWLLVTMTSKFKTRANWSLLEFCFLFFLLECLLILALFYLWEKRKYWLLQRAFRGSVRLSICPMMPHGGPRPESDHLLSPWYSKHYSCYYNRHELQMTLWNFPLWLS